MLGGGGGLGSAIATGMAFGAGSAIAHEAVRGVMGSGSGHGSAPVQQQQQYAEPQQQQMVAPAEYGQQAQEAPQNPCMNYNTYFLQCLKENASNIGVCQMNMNMLAQCEKDNALFFQSM